MKNRKLTFLISVLLLLITITMPPGAFADDEIQIDPSELVLNIDDNDTGTITIYTDLDLDNADWTTDNEDVVIIDGFGDTCEVYANEAGTATVTVTIDGYSASCVVTVEGGEQELCTVGGAVFSSLDDAITYAYNKPNNTITMCADLNMTEPVEIPGNINLDLNGKTVTVSDTLAAPAFNIQGKVSISNGTVKSSSAAPIFAVSDGAELTISGGYYESIANLIDAKGTLNITGGKFVCNDDLTDYLSDGYILETGSDGARQVIKAPDPPAFKSFSLLLSGQIGVNFYVDLPENPLFDYSESYTEFTVNGVTVRQELSTSRQDPDGNGYRGFTCYINSVQMAEPIKAVFHYRFNGNDATIEKTYSAKEYIVYISGNGNYTSEAVTLIKAIADYGHYVQPFLAVNNGWTVGVNHPEMASCNELTQSDIDAARSDTTGYAFKKKLAEGSGISRITFSLSLNSETTVNVFIYTSEGCSIESVSMEDGTALGFEMVGEGKYKVTKPNISAVDLGKTYKMIITENNAGTLLQDSVSVSALSYVNIVLTSDYELFNNDVARYAMTSLYRYYTSTVDYANN